MLQSNDTEEFGDVPTNQGGVGEGVERGRGEEEEGVSEEEGEKVKMVGQSDRYRIGHRNPQFSGAETTCLWELKQVRQCVP